MESVPDPEQTPRGMIGSGVMPTILRPVPDLRERVWGGRRLGAPRGQPIGEAWVAGPSSVVAEGPDAGRTLAEVAAREGASFVGRNAGARTGDRFPLLVKLIDPAAWLSVQVHPDDATARQLEGPDALGKAEAWYVLDATPDAELLVGVRGRIGTAAVRAAIADGSGSLAPLLARHRARSGDAIMVPAGTLHAVGPSIFLYEIQQPSNLTYRCDDWGRPTTPTRPLHISQALASVRPASRPRPRRAPKVDRATLVACEHFVLERLIVGPDRPAVLDPDGASVHVLTAIDGPVRIRPVVPGSARARSRPVVLGGLETVVVSAASPAYTIDAPAHARVLLARVP
jgi:mannose-6-phosphate isomerase